MEMNEALLGRRRGATADYYLLSVAWMDDWWFTPCPSSNNHTDERAKICRAPRRAPWQWCLNHGWSNVTADLSGRSVYILYFGPAIDTAENKVFSHSESSRSDFVVRVCVPLSKQLRESWSLSLFHGLESAGVWKDGLRLFLKRPRWWMAWCGRAVNGAVWGLLCLSFSLNRRSGYTDSYQSLFKHCRRLAESLQPVGFINKEGCRTSREECLSWRAEEKCEFQHFPCAVGQLKCINEHLLLSSIARNKSLSSCLAADVL